MHKAAKKGNLLTLNGGKEYTVPSTADPSKVIRRGNSPKYPIDKEANNDDNTIKIAVCLDNCPDAIGRYGLLILSISTSVIWFKPVI